MSDYIIIPGTNTRIYDGTVVILNRLPKTKWIVHYGYYAYAGKSQKGWYLSSIPAQTTMPLFTEDLVALRIVDRPEPPFPPVPPFPPPYPPGPPVPPVPTPTIFTPADKLMVDRSMISVDTLEDRDKLSSDDLLNGKICRVSDIDGEGNTDFYAWNAETKQWEEAILGYRYLTRDEIEQEIGTGIVSIVYSDSKGALVIANNAGVTSEVPLVGLAHNPVYASESMTLTIPVYGRENVVVTIPKDKYLTGVRYEENYRRPDGSYGPSIVFTVSDTSTSTEIVLDATPLRNVFIGGSTNTARINIEQGTNILTCDVKISTFANNALKVDNTGLYVDITGKVDKQNVRQNYVLVADGLGGFTQASNGIMIADTGTIADLTDPSKFVVTANLITQAIDAAMAEAGGTIEQFARRLDLMAERMDIFDERLTHVEIDHGTAIIDPEGDPMDTINVGGDVIDPTTTTSGVLATEAAVLNLFSFYGFN